MRGIKKGPTIIYRHRNIVKLVYRGISLRQQFAVNNFFSNRKNSKNRRTKLLARCTLCRLQPSRIYVIKQRCPTAGAFDEMLGGNGLVYILTRYHCSAVTSFRIANDYVSLFQNILLWGRGPHEAPLFAESTSQLTQ